MIATTRFTEDVKHPLMNFSKCQNRARASARPENWNFVKPELNGEHVARLD